MQQTNKSRIDKRKYTFEKYPSGTMAWYKNDQFHRDNNKSAIIYSNGYMAWYIDGEFIKEYKK